MIFTSWFPPGVGPDSRTEEEPKPSASSPEGIRPSSNDSHSKVDSQIHAEASTSSAPLATGFEAFASSDIITPAPNASGIHLGLKRRHALSNHDDRSQQRHCEEGGEGGDHASEAMREASAYGVFAFTGTPPPLVVSDTGGSHVEVASEEYPQSQMVTPKAAGIVHSSALEMAPRGIGGVALPHRHQQVPQHPSSMRPSSSDSMPDLCYSSRSASFGSLPDLCGSSDGSAGLGDPTGTRAAHGGATASSEMHTPALRPPPTQPPPWNANRRQAVALGTVSAADGRLSAAAASVAASGLAVVVEDRPRGSPVGPRAGRHRRRASSSAVHEDDAAPALLSDDSSDSGSLPGLVGSSSSDGGSGPPPLASESSDDDDDDRSSGPPPLIDSTSDEDDDVPSRARRLDQVIRIHNFAFKNVFSILFQK